MGLSLQLGLGSGIPVHGHLEADPDRGVRLSHDEVRQVEH